MNQPLKITLLDLGAPPDIRNLSGTVVDFSSCGMRVVVARSLPIGGAVRVDLSDALILGEVSYCAPHQDGFAIGLEIRHSLWNLARQTQLRAAFLNEASPPEMPVA